MGRGSDGLTHVDARGEARMVDVTGKPLQRRTAEARGRIALASSTVDLVRRNAVAKGDVLAVARIAGIQAAKRTPDLVPLCHPLSLGSVAVELTVEDDGIGVTARVACVGQTGAEMEALTAVSVALLTVYDMCKAVDRAMVIGPVSLVAKAKEDLA